MSCASDRISLLTYVRRKNGKRKSTMLSDVDGNSGEESLIKFLGELYSHMLWHMMKFFLEVLLF